MSNANTFTGTVGSDIRRTQTQAGVKVATFRLAVNDRRFDAKTQRWVDGETSWLTVVAFRQLAEHIAESLTKGQRVMVDGQLRVTPWEKGDKSGLNVEVLAADVAPSLLFGTSAFTKAVREQEPPAEPELDGWNPGNQD